MFLSMHILSDDELCELLKTTLMQALPELNIVGGADEPFYEAKKNACKATLFFRSNFPRSLLHEVAHYCLAGKQRRLLDDFGYWYVPAGRTQEQQAQFERVEARPQALEKIFCESLGLAFSPSLDDFSGRPPSEAFIINLNEAYEALLINTPPSATNVIDALKALKSSNICNQSD